VELNNVLGEHIAFLYGEDRAEEITRQLVHRLDRFRAAYPQFAATRLRNRVSELDSILITYGDMVQKAGQAPLQTLGSFFEKTIGDVVSTIHILPFFPYSSDDGFAVIDYQRVDPVLGDWSDVRHLGEKFRLMFDAVINHISAESQWFQGFLAGESRYQDYFFKVDTDYDISNVFRPRALPLLTEFETLGGRKKIWTTFSEDQIDLNYENPDVLLEVVDVLLKYVAEGAEFIRLDAVGFIWKESGSRCLHQPQTHRIIRLLRSVLDLVAPRVSIITETNVPHEENISYFGDGFNEAQMVYNFSLPPLTLYAMHTGNAAVLTEWASGLETPSNKTTFFNFLASHDGIGLMPARGYLSDDAIATMAERVLALGGLVSYKNNPDGSKSPYELNINFLDALGDPGKTDEDVKLVARRFMVTQSIMLTLRGVPGIYFHSLFGSQNWRDGVAEGGRNRSINREKLKLGPLEKALSDPNSLRTLVFKGYRQMLKARRADPAFHPMAGQQILDLGPEIFSVLRRSLDGTSHTLCLHNVTNHEQWILVDLVDFPIAPTKTFTDRLRGINFKADGPILKLRLDPYQVLWLGVDPGQAANSDPFAVKQ
jgi:glycosidase